MLSKADVLSRLAVKESLRGINLIRADLSSMALPGADLTEANLRMADLSRADLREIRLAGSHLSGAVMNDANLMGANLVEASMIGVSLRGANLSQADLSGADLTGANLDSAQLAGAFLVGAFLSETILTGADLSGAFIRMAQLGGSTLSGAILDGADLTHADLSGVRLDGCSMVGVNMQGAVLKSSYLTGCDLREADLSGADLTGCDLTAARLHGIRFEGVRLDDAWADWVDISPDGSGNQRASLEEVFAGVIGKPLAMILVEGQVGEVVWVTIVQHVLDFQKMHPQYGDIKLRAIQQGVNSAALYLEAESELSIAAYLAEFADILGKGSAELFEKLGAVVASHDSSDPAVSGLATTWLDREFDLTFGSNGSGVGLASGLRELEALRGTGFGEREKAIAILTGNRKVWLEVASSEALTLTPPHGVTAGIDLVHGRFVTNQNRRGRNPADASKISE